MSVVSRLARLGGRRAVVALPALLLTLALSAPARAAEVPNHQFLGTVFGGTKPLNPAELFGPKTPVLEAPCGVAVNPGGEIFTSDYYRRSILSSTVPAPALPAYYPENGPCALAADSLDLYANYWHGGVVNVEFGEIDPGPATGIAVDPESGDLYVNHGTSIAVYKAPVGPGKAPALEIDPGVGGELKDGYGLAVSAFPATKGWVYVADAADNLVKVYDPAVSLTAPVKVIDGANTAAGRFVSLTDASLALDQENGDLFVVDNTQPGFEHPVATVVEFNAKGIYRGQLPRTIVDGEPTGITVDESVNAANGDVYVTSGNGISQLFPPADGPLPSELGSLYSFGPAGEGQMLEATTSGTGQGSVKSKPSGISCPGACEAELNSGAQIVLTAEPSAGSAFGGWSGGTCAGSNPKCQLTLGSTTAVNAEFIPAPAGLSVGPRGAAAEGIASPVGAGPSAATLTLGRPVAHGSTAFLQATAPGPGTLSATGKGLAPTEARFAHAGSFTLRLRLDRAGRRALARSKSGRLALRVGLAFRPSYDAAGSVVSKAVTFEQTIRERR